MGSGVPISSVSEAVQASGPHDNSDDNNNNDTNDNKHNSTDCYYDTTILLHYSTSILLLRQAVKPCKAVQEVVRAAVENSNSNSIA